MSEVATICFIIIIFIGLISIAQSLSNKEEEKNRNEEIKQNISKAIDDMGNVSKEDEQKIMNIIAELDK